ncbi:MAG: hypothetical protein IRY91_06270 [Gemmatimonadaceae bacterium]|nr:hypothetical protein [Gemmatimonadaceae bacterium]
MIAAWMLRAAVTALLVAIAAWLADAVAQLFGRPRRWIWAGALGAAALLPVAAQWAPIASLLHLLAVRWLPLSALLAAIPRLPAAVALPGAAHAAPVDAALASVARGGVWNGVLLLAWGGASVVVAGVLVAVHLRTRAARASWTSAHLDGHPVFLADETGPAVVGVVRPAVVLPAWVLRAPAEARRLILRHEWEHLAAGDSRLLAAAVVAVALTPWNAALWWLYRRLRWAVETDCDARVLASGADVRAYGELLLAAAARWTASLHLSPTLGAHTSLLERRLLAMTAVPRSHRPLRALPLLAALALVGAAACDTASPTETAAAPHASERKAIPVTSWTVQRAQIDLRGKNGATFTLVPASDTSLTLVTTKDGTAKVTGVVRFAAQKMVLNGQELSVSGHGTMVFGDRGDSAPLFSSRK